jgi:O-antigen ligase
VEKIKVTSQNYLSKISMVLTIFFVLTLSIIIALATTIISNGLLTVIATIFIIGFLIITLRWPVVALYVFLLLLSIYPVINKVYFENNAPLALRLWQEAYAIFFVIVAAHQILAKKRKELKIKIIDWSIIVLFLISIYGALLAGDLDLIMYGFHLSYTPIIMYFLVRLLLVSQMHIKYLVKLFLIISLVIAVIGIYIHFTDPLTYYSRLVVAENLEALSRLGRWRMSSIFGNPLYFGTLMALAAILSITLFLSNRSEWYWLLACGVFAACTWWSITRGAWIMLAAGIAIVAWAHIRRTYGILWVSLIPITAVFGIGVFASGVGQPQLEHYLSDSSGFLLTARYDQWTEAWHAIQKAPFGYGLGVGNAMLRAGSVDSVAIYDGWYLKILAEAGLLGIAVFAVFMICTIATLLNGALNAQDDNIYWLCFGVLGIFVGFSLAAVGSNVWDYYMTPSVMWMLIAFAVTCTDMS